MIDISLTNEQYGDLLRLVRLGNHLANDTYRQEDRDPHYDEVEQLVMAQAEKAGFGDLVSKDDKTGLFSPSALFENQPEIHETLDDHADETFWVELVWRMAARDLIRQRGSEAVDSMSMDERIEAEGPYRERYAIETGRYGIDRLVVES